MHLLFFPDTSLISFFLLPLLFHLHQSGSIWYFVSINRASLVAQMVKDPSAVWETWFGSLDWEDLLEEGMAIHSSILAWRIPMDKGAWWATVHEVAKSRT